MCDSRPQSLQQAYYLVHDSEFSHRGEYNTTIWNTPHARVFTTLLQNISKPAWTRFPVLGFVRLFLELKLKGSPGRTRYKAHLHLFNLSTERGRERKWMCSANQSMAHTSSCLRIKGTAEQSSFTESIESSGLTLNRQWDIPDSVHAICPFQNNPLSPLEGPASRKTYRREVLTKTISDRRLNREVGPARNWRTNSSERETKTADRRRCDPKWWYMRHNDMGHGHPVA